MKTSVAPGLVTLLAGLLFAFGSPARADDGGIHSYAAHGVIQKIAPDKHTVTIHHQAIPGYMMEMTMDFPVHDPHGLDGLVPGDQVTFTLKVSPTDAWIENVHKVGHTQPDAGSAPMMNMKPGSSMMMMETKPVPGDPLPDATFIAEDGRTIHLSDFRGKVMALTFFFTRCPLPNYCPLMNRNFAATREMLLAGAHGFKNWEFLSISFDPDFDQPETLASYANFYRQHNPDRWLFVAATPESLRDFAAPLGLMLMRQGGSISHNLRTVVIDPQGRLFRQFNDNLWQPAQLAGAMKDAAHSVSPS